MRTTRLKFNYKNWKGEDHSYLVEPSGLAYERAKFDADKDLYDAWALRGLVVERDGEERNVVRSFKIADMRDVEEVER